MFSLTRPNLKEAKWKRVEGGCRTLNMGAGKRAREEMEREGGKRWRKEGAVMNQTRFASFYTVIASIFF